MLDYRKQRTERVLQQCESVQQCARKLSLNSAMHVTRMAVGVSKHHILDLEMRNGDANNQRLLITNIRPFAFEEATWYIAYDRT